MIFLTSHPIGSLTEKYSKGFFIIQPGGFDVNICLRGEADACPEHTIIAGGGVIGIEFATLYYRLGVKVTIVEMLDRVLGPLDKDITDFVEAELKKNGVELVLGVRVESIESGLKVNYASVKDGSKGTAQGDVVLMAGGRIPNTKGLVKFVFDKTSDEILGFHVIGPRATDLAAEVTAVMECEGTIAELGSTVHPHPTVSEVVMEAAHVCHGTCVNAPKARR